MLMTGDGKAEVSIRFTHRQASTGSGAHKVGRPINVSMDVAMVNPARGAMDATVEWISAAATNIVMKANRHIAPKTPRRISAQVTW